MYLYLECYGHVLRDTVICLLIQVPAFDFLAIVLVIKTLPKELLFCGDAVMTN